MFCVACQVKPFFVAVLFMLAAGLLTVYLTSGIHQRRARMDCSLGEGEPGAEDSSMIDRAMCSPTQYHSA